MAPATEAELVALYIMAHEAVFIRIILKELVINNQPSPFKPTTPLPNASSMARSNHNALKPWTCTSTGSVTQNTKNNSASTGAPENSTMLITGPNIIQQPITRAFGVNSLQQCWS